MVETVELKYVDDRLLIGMVDIRQAFALSSHPILLQAEVYRGKLVYRSKGSTKRISYSEIKKGLVKRKLVIEQEVPGWLY